MVGLFFGSGSLGSLGSQFPRPCGNCQADSLYVSAGSDSHNSPDSPPAVARARKNPPSCELVGSSETKRDQTPGFGCVIFDWAGASSFYPSNTHRQKPKCVDSSVILGRCRKKRNRPQKPDQAHVVFRSLAAACRLLFLKRNSCAPCGQSRTLCPMRNRRRGNPAPSTNGCGQQKRNF